MKCFLDINDEILEKDNIEKLHKINIKTGNYGKITLPTLDLFRIFIAFSLIGDLIFGFFGIYRIGRI